MKWIIEINARGRLTLPQEARQTLGLAGAGQIVVEPTEDGLLLRSGITLPIEIYSKARLAEFARADGQLQPYKMKIQAARRAATRGKTPR